MPSHVRTRLGTGQVCSGTFTRRWGKIKVRNETEGAKIGLDPLGGSVEWGVTIGRQLLKLELIDDVHTFCGRQLLAASGCNLETSHA